jgi:peptidoglycan/LPS O-acetylase OafA/YrhL
MIEKRNQYFYSLDLFRGFCGYGVAITHLYAFVFENFFMEYLSFLFVEFFFVLSGFVLYPQLLKVLNNKKNLLKFYQRRWLRTLPLYFISLLLVSILTNNIFTLDFFKYLTLTQNIIPNFISDSYYPIAWSLSIEEMFYLLFPIFLIKVNSKNFISYAFFIFIFILICKLFLAPYVEANYYRTGTFLRLDAILLGFILCHFRNYIIKRHFIILSSCVLLLFIYFTNYNFFISNKHISIINVTFILLMQFTSISVMLAFIQLESLLVNKILKKCCTLISNQTYSIYLLHIIFIYILKEINYGVYFTSFIYILLLFLTSSLVYKFFEKPILRLRPKLI